MSEKRWSKLKKGMNPKNVENDHLLISCCVLMDIIMLYAVAIILWCLFFFPSIRDKRGIETADFCFFPQIFFWNETKSKFFIRKIKCYKSWLNYDRQIIAREKMKFLRTRTWVEMNENLQIVCIPMNQDTVNLAIKECSQWCHGADIVIWRFIVPQHT